ncbi:MAG: glutathione S-transferase family protein [Deltaproteobacteria bacterium]|nr:glutathione S-transferase family protein [Deltaproteobacteria bacterium]
MAESYRIFGVEMSPYSVKVRSYFRYKGIPHEWVVRGIKEMPEFQKYAKLPLVPLVVSGTGEAMQDSTPIIETFEKKYPDPSITPSDPTLAFLSALIEEYADEWGNKPMFHYRWTYEADQKSGAERIFLENMPGAAGAALDQGRQMIMQRMVPRLKFVGSNPVTLPMIEDSFKRTCRILERHLSGRDFLMGGRPVMADFGLYAQIYECSTDPTPGVWMKANAPQTLAWIQRMLSPRATGELETPKALEPTLEPLLREEIGALFLPWSAANAKAVAAGSKEFSMELAGKPWVQEPQKYAAKSLGVIRQKYQMTAGKDLLDPLLERTGCLPWLKG